MSKGPRRTPACRSDGERVWHRMSVPLLGRGRTLARIGIYHYVDVPPGHDGRDQTWLERYGADPSHAAACVLFDPTDLAPTTLEWYRQAFVAECSARAVRPAKVPEGTTDEDVGEP